MAAILFLIATTIPNLDVCAQDQIVDAKKLQIQIEYGRFVDALIDTGKAIKSSEMLPPDEFGRTTNAYYLTIRRATKQTKILIKLIRDLSRRLEFLKNRPIGIEVQTSQLVGGDPVNGFYNNTTLREPTFTRINQNLCRAVGSQFSSGDFYLSKAKGQVTMLESPEAKTGTLIGTPASKLNIVWSNDKSIKSWDDLKGKAFVLDFWTTTCGHCVKIFPELKKLQQQLPDGVQLIGVSSPQGMGTIMKIFTGILSSTVFFISLTNLSAQADAQVTSIEKKQEQVITPKLSPMGLPVEKADHPKGYYEAWLEKLKESEKTLQNPDTPQWNRTIHHWSRFLNYYKMIPDDASQILTVFMESYTDDKHKFCADYNEWIPLLTSGEYAYCLKHYTRVKPVMDEVVRLVLDSYDKELINQFEKILVSDQNIRANIPDDASLEKQNELLARQREIDLNNLKIIESVIADHGYPGRSLVGVKYEEVAFLVIQHNGGEIIEKYLPAIKTAIENEDVEPSIYPFLFDRLQVSKGLPQHFGTQRTHENKLFKVHDPDNLNKRRAEYGLPIFLPNPNKPKPLSPDSM